MPAVDPSAPTPAAAVAPARPGRWLIANLIAQIAFGLLAMTICLPSMQEWGAIFGARQSAVQLTFSGYLMAYGLLQLIYGPLSDRHGRRPVLMIGLALAGVGSLFSALADDLTTLIAARVIQGAGAAAGMVVGRAAVQDLFLGPQRTRIMAYVGMATGLCPPAATLFGGHFHVHLGWQANFYLIGTLSVVLLVAAWRGLPHAQKSPVTHTRWLPELLKSYARLARESAFLLYVAVLSLTVAAFYAFLGGAPIVLRAYGIGPASIGWYIMVVPLSFIVGNFLTSRLIDRQGERRMMLAGQVASVVGIGLMLCLGLAGAKTPLAFCLPLMLMGLGHGLLMPACLAGTIGLLPALAGAAAAVAGLSQQLMGALGGYMVGWFSHDGSVNLALLMMAFTLSACGAQAALHGSRRMP